MSNAHTKEKDLENLAKVLREALTHDAPDHPALVARIPLICNDIRDIKNSMQWHRWLLLGIVGGIGAIFVAIVIEALSK